MATERQIQIPGGAYVNETTDQKEMQIPGGPYINEDTQAITGWGQLLDSSRNRLIMVQ